MSIGRRPPSRPARRFEGDADERIASGTREREAVIADEEVGEEYALVGGVHVVRPVVVAARVAVHRQRLGRHADEGVLGDAFALHAALVADGQGARRELPLELGDVGAKEAIAQRELARREGGARLLPEGGDALALVGACSARRGAGDRHARKLVAQWLQGDGQLLRLAHGEIEGGRGEALHADALGRDGVAPGRRDLQRVRSVRVREDGAGE